jgi:integrase
MAGHISKRGPNTWRVRINFGTDEDGRRRTFNKTIHGPKKAAEKFLLKKLTEKDEGTFIQPSAESLNAYLDRWLVDSAKPRLAESTYENYKYLLGLYVRKALGARKLADVRLIDIQRLYSDLTAAGRSPRTVRYVHAILRSAFAQAITWRLIAVNPCTGADLPQKAHVEMKAFSPDEAKRFLAAAKADRLSLLFAFALESGMRPEEYLALKWADIDFAKQTATVQRTLVRRKTKGGGWYFGKPKTAKSRRCVPMSREIFAELKAHRTAQLEQMMLLGTEYDRNDLVFANDFGRPLDLKNIRTRNFARILEAAGLGHYEKVDNERVFVPGFRVYDLRHSMATLMLANGENPKVVSERLGHASIVLTLDTYSHVLPNMQQDATARLGAVLYG